MNGQLSPEQFAKSSPKFAPTSFSETHHHLLDGVVPASLHNIVSEVINYFTQEGKLKGGCTMFYVISDKSSTETEAHNKVFIARSGNGMEKSDDEQKLDLEFDQRFSKKYPLYTVTLLPQYAAMFRKYYIYDKFAGMEAFKNSKLDFTKFRNLIVFISIDRVLKGIKEHGMVLESFRNPNLQDEFLKIEEVIDFLEKTLQNWEEIHPQFITYIHHFKSLYLPGRKRLEVWEELESIKDSHTEIYKLCINKIPSVCGACSVLPPYMKIPHECECSNGEAGRKFRTFRSTKADLIKEDLEEKMRNLSKLWDFLFEQNDKDVLNNFAGCAESNLLEYLATHPDVLDEPGNHIIFAVMNSSVSSTNRKKNIEICSPCLYCCWVFPHYFDLIGQSRLIKWGAYREHFKKGAEKGVTEHIFLHLVSERRFRDFERYYEGCCVGKHTLPIKQFTFNSMYNLWLDRHTALHHASFYHSQIEFVQFILDKEPGMINLKTYAGLTPLHCAVLNCHPKIVEYLLSFKGIVNIKDDNNLTAFNHSIISRNGEIINLFLKMEGIDVSYDAPGGHSNALIAASTFSTLEVVKEVYKMMERLGKGFDINHVYREETITALSQAIDRNAVEIFDFLLSKGANVYMPVAKGWNLEAIFLRLIRFRRWEMMRSFLFLHLDKPDKLEKLQNMKMDDNATALHMVAKRAQSVDNVKMLTELGFKMNKDKNGNTPLEIAIEGSDIQKHLEKYILERDVAVDTDCIEKAPKLWEVNQS